MNNASKAVLLLAIILASASALLLSSDSMDASSSWPHDQDGNTYTGITKGDFYDTESRLSFKIVDNSDKEVEVSPYFNVELGNPFVYTYFYNGDITVPESVTNPDDGQTYKVVGIGYNAFTFANPGSESKITSITLNEGLEYIEPHAFVGLSIDSINIPSSVKRIGNVPSEQNYTSTSSVFCDIGAGGIKNVSFSANSQLEIIGQGAFSYTNITSLDLPDSIREIGFSAFIGCTNLTSITIPDSIEFIESSAFMGVNAKVYVGEYEATIEGGSLKYLAQVGNKSYVSLAAALADVPEAGSETAITLLDDTTESVTIESELSITINLNGHKITNSENQHTITVEGELTIIDDTGEGVIDNTSHGKSAIYNNGTVTIKGGNITKSVNVAGNTYYVVFNHGVMNIEGGHIYSEGTATSSLIVNGYSQPATMTISGGLIEFWFNAVKNEEYGTLTVNGGTINSDNQSIQNWNTATISGGTFNGEVATWHYNANHGSHAMTITGGTFNDDVYTAKYVDNLHTGDISSITDNPKITITGGTFNGGLYTLKGDLTNSEILYPTEDEPYDWMDVSGGTFTNRVEDRFIAPGFALTGENGNYGVVQGHKITFEVNVDVYDVEVKSSSGAIMNESMADGSYLLVEGTYKATFTADGYETVVLDFEVTDSDCTIPVEMLAVLGITITATPSGAEITIDGKPIENGSEVQLTEGMHTVTVSLDGYVTETFEITVGEGKQTSYAVSLNPIDDGSDYPTYIPDDDDDYVPLPPQVVYDDDEVSVTVAACVAAAVIVAILAAFIIMEYRKK